MSTPAQYSNEIISGEERVRRIAEIFHNNGNPKNAEALVWQYENGPAGPALSLFSISDTTNEDAAVYSIFPVIIKFYDQKRVASQSLDTLTDINHRGNGLFTVLAKQTYKEATQKDWAYVYGFPNRFSAPGFFSKLGWIQKSAPPFKMHVNNLAFPWKYKFKSNLFIKNVFSHFLRSRRIEKMEQVGYKISVGKGFMKHSYDKLWDLYSSNINVCVDRNSDYLRWRYLDKPNTNYNYLYVLGGDGCVRALVVYLVTDKHNGKIGYIMDLIYEPENKALGGYILDKSISIMLEEKVDVVLAWADYKFEVNSPYCKSGFFQLPRKLQPIKLFFGYAPLAAQKFDSSDFFLSYADSDTV